MRWGFYWTNLATAAFLGDGPVSRSVGQLVGWWVGGLVGWLIGRSVGWLVG